MPENSQRPDPDHEPDPSQTTHTASDDGSPGETPSARDYPSDVHVLNVNGREIVLVGTAHISRESVDLVHEVIDKERPDTVCVELDEQRFEALSQEQRWESLDLREVIRNRQLTTLMANLLLASYQRRLGGKLGVVPGSELVEAIKLAEQLDIPVSLCDRDIRVTLRRAWHSLAWWKKLMLIAQIVGSAFDTPEIDEEELRALREKDVLNELMAEIGAAAPDIKRVLIDERDAFLAERIRQTEGSKLVAVVGAGHVAGMVEALERAEETELESLNEIPEVSPVWKWFGWGLPCVIVGMIAYIGFTQGIAAAGANALYWFVANAIPASLGALLAGGHPLAILAGGFGAPFTSLTPLIGAGYVAAFAQVWMAPPFVHEFESISDDVAKASRWWRSRLLRVFLVFLGTTFGSMIGSWVGGYEIVTNLVSG